MVVEEYQERFQDSFDTKYTTKAENCTLRATPSFVSLHAEQTSTSAHETSLSYGSPFPMQPHHPQNLLQRTERPSGAKTVVVLFVGIGKEGKVWYSPRKIHQNNVFKFICFLHILQF